MGGRAWIEKFRYFRSWQARHLPSRAKSRPVSLSLPQINTAAGVVAAIGSVADSYLWRDVTSG